MIYGSCCSGIEAATVAWHSLGWRPAFFSEIEPFPSAVLAHHYPDVPNLGDMNDYRGWHVPTFDVLVGGTPCQSFSVAGLRKGLDDPRGNLALVYLGLVDRFRPRWVVWENVPGVLSSNKGRDFGAFLGALGELGYGFAYRVLDAQFFGVPQRRRRVFVVGHLGDWRAAAAVLFERESLRGDSPPRRETGEGIANAITERPDRGGGNSEGQRLIAHAVTCYAVKGGDPTTDNYVAHSLRAEGFDASEDGTGRGTPIVPALVSNGDAHSGFRDEHGLVPAVAFPTEFSNQSAAQDQSPSLYQRPMAVAFPWQQGGDHTTSFNISETAPSLVKNQTPAVLFADCFNGSLGSQAPTMGTRGSSQNSSGPTLLDGMAVRRLTPRECERLQGFPDDWTLVPYRNKPAADGPRYKALGNSMAVPVMRWIGERIAAVDALLRNAEEAA